VHNTKFSRKRVKSKPQPLIPAFPAFDGAGVKGGGFLAFYHDGTFSGRAKQQGEKLFRRGDLHGNQKKNERLDGKVREGHLSLMGVSGGVMGENGWSSIKGSTSPKKTKITYGISAENPRKRCD